MIESGTWEYMRREGLWHFDPHVADPPVSHRVIAHIDGDLAQVIAEVPTGEIKSLESSMSHRPECATFFDRIQAGNVADAERLGLDPSMPYAEVFDDKLHDVSDRPLVERLVERLPLVDAYWKLHRQRPGQVWPIHFDNYHAFDRDPGQLEAWADPGVRRLWIMLTDWQWGQFVQVGNHVWSHWSAGDVLYFDWLVPHGSANCGHSDRVSLLVTGRVTEELQQWVEGTAPRVIDLA